MRKPAPAPATTTGMAVEAWPIGKPKPYGANPRRNDKAVPKVASSLREFGWRQPIVVDEKGVVIVGHTRLLAARSLGMTEVPVHVATGLTPAQVRAYRLADNRTNEEAEWDDAALASELAALDSDGFDLALTGFDGGELERLLDPPGVTVEAADEAEVPAPAAEPMTRPGDLIRLGRHRLLCGDATDSTAWDALMAGDTADLVWTDPPYGVSYGEKNAMLNRVMGAGSGADRSLLETPIGNDSLTAEQLTDFLRASLSLTCAHTRPGGVVYVAAPPGPLHHCFATVLSELGVWRHTLQWVKDGFVLGRSDYHYRHEPIFYGWKAGAAHTWNGGRSQDSVLECPRPRKNDLHPTMKPVALIARCIENSSDPGALVADPFGGSGSTLMAAEATGRRAALMELSPAYCDVIVARWEHAAGAVAVRP